ncbi:MAG: type II toxin-antitoxin system HicB family antitoxin [Lamprobacter sp.]|uniref:type II toxin-antitoxin system HicB family antitoxin n=1 Tax=Lamprobacter sp. TaxID=3100796 RepID=UPI002B25ABA7|nr:type II toxin-antitoxin system HicB family antitoxin [Lamprobacter sp.]MEA3642802.1 type II toxin-antitoxin system HicB family antitoxin [Lamprobacter sp.]
MNNRLPRCTLRPLTPDEGEGYLIEFPDYPGCMADGPTPEAALREGYDALHSYLETLKALGRPVPGARWDERLRDEPAQAVGSR